MEYLQHIKLIKIQAIHTIKFLYAALQKMGRIYEHRIGYITLLGGEPTLHEGLIDCIKIVRREFPDSQLIILTKDPEFFIQYIAVGGNGTHIQLSVFQHIKLIKIQASILRGSIKTKIRSGRQ